MADPLALPPLLSEQLYELLCQTAARSGGAGVAALKTALDDLEVRALVISIQIRGAPGASLIQTVRQDDAMTQWLNLSCI